MSAQLASAHHRFTVNDCYRMTEAGIFSEDERIELINGELFDMAPIGSFHAGMVTRLSRLLIRMVAERAVVAVQNPIYLSEHSSPEPDIALLKPRADDYMRSLPTAQDVLLVIEVADSSQHYDRHTKLPLYAKHRIPEVWLIDVKARQFDIYQQPDEEYYRLHLRPKAQTHIHPLLVDSVSLDWQGLFAEDS